MASISSIALSGMNAAQVQLNVSANNIANMNTPDYKRQAANLKSQPQGGVQASVSTTSDTGDNLAADIVGQLQAKNAFLANLAVFKTHDKMVGALFNEKA
jgi:flagellar hook protein FlgE